MILDNEDQRKTILSLITVAPIKGTYADVQPAVAALDALKARVVEAKIAAPA